MKTYKIELQHDKFIDKDGITKNIVINLTDKTFNKVLKNIRKGLEKLPHGYIKQDKEKVYIYGKETDAIWNAIIYADDIESILSNKILNNSFYKNGETY